MGSMKISWNPRNFHGLHENFVESMKFSWNPRNFHGIHENFMEPMKISWDPWNFHGFHGNFRGKFVENFMDPTNAPRNPWNPWKINWIVPLSTRVYMLGYYHVADIFTWPFKHICKFKKAYCKILKVRPDLTFNIVA